MARVIDMTALRKQLEALERAAMEASQNSAPAQKPAAQPAPPVQEGRLRSSRAELDDNDEGVSTEGPQDRDRIAAAPVMQRAQAKGQKYPGLLGSPKELRRAIILSEILSPPVSRRR